MGPRFNRGCSETLLFYLRHMNIIIQSTEIIKKSDELGFLGVAFGLVGGFLMFLFMWADTSFQGNHFIKSILIFLICVFGAIATGLWVAAFVCLSNGN